MLTLMIDKNKRARITLRVFYLLVLYMLAQLCWWGFKLAEVHKQMLEMRTIITGINQYDELMRKYYMIAGEGAAFLLIFAVAVYIIFHNLRQEFRRSEREKTFLLSTSHELRTPLTTVKLVLETLKRPSLSETQRAELIGNALAETSRLQWLTENILLASRIGHVKTLVPGEDCDLRDIVSHEIHARTQITSGGPRIEFENTAAVLVQGDKPMLSLLVSNLLDNALKYSPSGEPITVTLGRQGQRFLLAVADRGPGIPPEEQSRVFEKFFRGGSEEIRQHKGTGLGLYLVREIARLHGAEVRFRPNHPTGSIFEVEFLSA